MSIPDHASDRQPPRPTRASPGSSDKVEVLVLRAQLGLRLWHPLDAPLNLA